MSELGDEFRDAAADLIEDLVEDSVKATVRNPGGTWDRESGSSSGTDQIYEVDSSPPFATNAILKDGTQIPAYRIIIAQKDLEAATPSQGDPTPVAPGDGSTVAISGRPEPAGVIRVDTVSPDDRPAYIKVYVSR